MSTKSAQKNKDFNPVLDNNKLTNKSTVKFV